MNAKGGLGNTVLLARIDDDDDEDDEDWYETRSSSLAKSILQGTVPGGKLTKRYFYGFFTRGLKFIKNVFNKFINHNTSNINDLAENKVL